jgi:hypothetical protein
VQNEIKERSPQELYNYENLRYEQNPKHRMKSLATRRTEEYRYMHTRFSRCSSICSIVSKVALVTKKTCS